MSAQRLATRYAKSLLDIAQEQGKLELVKNDVHLIDRTLETSHDLVLMLKNPIITADKKQTVLDKIFKANVSDIMCLFLALLVKKGREGFLRDITRTFLIQYNTLKNITPVTLTSAVSLDADQVADIVNGLKQKEQLGDIQLKETVDSTLVGGFVLHYGDKQIDTSVKRSLSKLRAVIDDDSYVKKYA